MFKYLVINASVEGGLHMAAAVARARIAARAARAFIRGHC